MAAVLQPGTSQYSMCDAVRPSDSISRDGTPEHSTTRSLVVVEPPAANLVDFGAISDPEVAKLALQYASDYHLSYREYCKAATGDVTGSSDSCASGSSFVDLPPKSWGGSRAGSFASRRSGLSAKSLRAASRASSWSGSRVTASFPEGYCYSRMLRDGARDSVVRALGSWPTLRQVFDQPAEGFLPLFAMHKMVLAESGNIGYHVTSGCSGLPMNTALVRLARRTSHTFGTFGHLLSGTQVPSGTAAVLDLIDLDTKVGGVGSVSGKSSYGYGEPSLVTHRRVAVASSPLDASVSAAEQSRNAFAPVAGHPGYVCYVHEVDFTTPGLSSPARYALVEVPLGSHSTVRLGNCGDGQVVTVLVSPGVSVHLGQSCVVPKSRLPCVFVCRSFHGIRFDASYDVVETGLPVMLSSCKQLLDKGYCYGLRRAV